jgi:hypothetical protein
MLDLLIVAYAQFVTKVTLQQYLYWPIADWMGFQEVEAPRFPDIWHMKVVGFSPQEIFLVLIFARGVFTPGP